MVKNRLPAPARGAATTLGLLWLAALAPRCAAAAGEGAAGEVGAQRLRAHVEFLASDALRGRGSATPDEHVAALYVASQLRHCGVSPAGDDGGYLQKVELVRRVLKDKPTLSATPPRGEPLRWTHGVEMRVVRLAAPRLSGPLQKLEAGGAAAVRPGAVVLLAGEGATLRADGQQALGRGAAALLVVEAERSGDGGERHEPALPELRPALAGSQADGAALASGTVVLLQPAAARALAALPDASTITLEAPTETLPPAFTWNVVGVLRGGDPRAAGRAVLLSAHLDHIGTAAAARGDDAVYNGANDDASGVAAVLELARLLGAGPRPRRSVVFALFGSEETGGQGSMYFRDHPPLPLDAFVANLQFEVVGRPDPKASGFLLTGFDRSDLGPSLAARGGRLAADPYPEQHLFERSDNYVLAKRGVVAHAVAGHPLYQQYHGPDDELDVLDLKFMAEALQSLVRPLRWLLDSGATPGWRPGRKP